MSEAVNHPSHYGGGDNPYEVIKVIRAWDLGFNLGNTVKYVARAGKKDPKKHLEDLKKAKWYLDDEIRNLESKEQPQLNIEEWSDEELSKRFDDTSTVSGFGSISRPLPEFPRCRIEKGQSASEINESKDQLG